MKDIGRRDFLKYTGTGMAALVVGSGLEFIMEDPAYAAVAVQQVVLEITDTIKEMVTHNAINTARCYFWIYQSHQTNTASDPPPDCPGPVIFTSTGTAVQFIITNSLDEPHALSIPALGFTTGPIAPGTTITTKKFKPKMAGTFMYYDDMNAPVNRVMGLHGAFVVMPKAAVKLAKARQAGNVLRLKHRPTPYDKPGKNVQQLFDDLGNTFGTAPWWPGLAWDEGDTTTDTPSFRQNVWVMHQASPNLFAAVGGDANGPIPISFTTTDGRTFTDANPRDPNVFTAAFLHSSFSPTRQNFVPQYFTISGQSGHFAHNSPWICPYARVGEPYLIRVLNAGLWLHSTHQHANHGFLLSRNLGIKNAKNQGFDPFPGDNDNPIWVDLFSGDSLSTYDYIWPFMRPPDVPNDMGIGRDDLQQSLDVSATATPMPAFGIAPGGPPFAAADIPQNPDPATVLSGNVPAGHLTWPPLQELSTFIPQVGTTIAKAQDGVTDIDLAVRLSPVCYPMHDHSEPSQVAQGGNYNCGLISGFVFTGDRKGARPGQTSQVITFIDRPDSNDPAMQVPHGPDTEGTLFQAVLPPAKPFNMPSIP